jgi:hypothetical protein
MVHVDPATQFTFLQVFAGGKLNKAAAELLTQYPYCVVTGCKREPGSILRYDAIETEKLPDYLFQMGNNFFVVSCFPSPTWELAAYMQSELQRTTEQAIAANFSSRTMVGF